MKYYSSIFYMICLLMTINIAATAQKKINGIYRTMDDYLANQLSYTKDSSSKAPGSIYIRLRPRVM